MDFVEAETILSDVMPVVYLFLTRLWLCLPITVVLFLFDTTVTVALQNLEASAESLDVSVSASLTGTTPQRGCNASKPDLSPCAKSRLNRDSYAPDFIYRPGRKKINDKYGRIQDCQSKMIIRPGDEFWWVSSRHLPLNSCGDFDLCIYRFLDGQVSQKTMVDLKNAHQSNPDLINFVYAHENRADLNKAEMRFWQTYNILINQAADAPSVRFIFFSWPADEVRGQIRDVKAKATICDHHAFYFAHFLYQIQDFNRVSLGGYSYGARLIINALTLCGGGCVNGRSVPQDQRFQKPSLRAVFVASALPNSGLGCAAYQHLDHVTFLNNSQDGVLKFFGLLSVNRTQALGRTGVCSTAGFPDRGGKIRQLDVACIAGKSHKIEDYFKSESLRQIIRDTIFWRDVAAEKPR